MDRRLSLGRPTLGLGQRLGAPPDPPTTPFRADAFALALPAGWADATVYQIAGPVADGLAHQITVSATPHDGRTPAAVADEQVRAALDALPGAALLIRDALALGGGGRAERSVLRWSSGRILYQQVLVSVVGGQMLTLGAVFTARSRRALGPEVQRIMLSLAAPPPVEAPRRPPSRS